MSVELIGIIGIFLLMFLLFAGMWLGFAMAFVGFIGLVIVMGFDGAVTVMATIPYTRSAFYSISALPLFTFMGVVVGASGIGNDLYDTAYKWFGRLPGGLAVSTIFASGGFAAITGSSSASIVTLGSVAIPEMKKFKYKNLKELILRIQPESMEKQRTILDQTLEEWRGDVEQLDDILVIGRRF